MKKIITSFILLFIGVTSNAQGIHGGFSSGTQLLKIEAGYSLDENIHLGAYYSLGMDLNIIPLPSSYGAYGRYTFNKREIVNNNFFSINMRPYLGASLGLIQSDEVINFNFFDGTQSTIPAVSELGYLASAGIELLYGNKSSWGSFFEIGVGNAPNYYRALNSTLNQTFTNETPEGVSALSFNIGIRFYLQ